jgi:hypothetical protein
MWRYIAMRAVEVTFCLQTLGSQLAQELARIVQLLLWKSQLSIPSSRSEVFTSSHFISDTRLILSIGNPIRTV